MAARITGASLDPILTRLNGVDNYHPLDADTFSDWSIEAGDLVTVSRDGVQYKSPVHTSTMTWKGTTPQVQIRSTGKETRDPVSVASRKKYGRGSSALLNSQQAYRDITTSYNNMKAGLILASSSARLWVEDSYTQMTAGLDLTSSTAVLYAKNRTTRAAIIARINADGEGEALIEADKVRITGETTINSALIINNDGDMVVKKNAVFQGNIFLQTADAKLKIGAGTAIQFLGTPNSYDLDATLFKSMIRKAEIDSNTNTLKLWKVTDSDNNPSILFRKAASSLSGSWSSGNFPLTVTDGTNNYTIGIGGSYGDHDVELEIVTNGSVTKDSLVAQTVDVPIKAAQLNNGAASTDRYTKTLAVSVSSLLETKQATSNGTYTPDSDKIGFSSVTVAFALDDADVEAAQANETKSVRVRSKSGSTYSSYKSLAMSQSTYTPQGQSSAHDCIIVSDGNTTVGRYDIATYGNNKYVAGGQAAWFDWSDTPKTTNYPVTDAVGKYMTGYYKNANGTKVYWDTSWGPIPSGVLPTSSNIQIDSYEYKSSQPSGTQAQNMWNSIKNGQSDPTMKYWRFRVYVQNPNNTSQKLCEKYYWFQYT